MAEEEAPSFPETSGWDPSSRSVSDSTLGSFSSSSEQLALTGFAHQLYSVSTSNDPCIAEENDVRQEAKLLMSLACVTPNSISIQSGRVSPPSDSSSYTTSFKRNRDSFRFACPSLSLEVHSRDVDLQETTLSLSRSFSSQNQMESAPAALLGRVLQVDDRDALRLSSEAMARNIMQSYEKAIQWRIQSWIDSLSGILVDKENELHSQGLATEDNIRLLCESSEAMLVILLRQISRDIDVVDACNNFKVLAQRAPESEPKIKKQRSFDDQSTEPLEETEYEYTVSHLLCFECNLNIHAPAIGNASINLQVPGTIQGTFVSLEDGSEHLAGVVIDVNTGILASMIEKSSRIVVRSSIEALLQQERHHEVTQDEQAIVHEAEIDNGSISEDSCIQEGEGEFPPSSYTPKRKLSDERVAGLIVITPRESSSPSSFEDSDTDDRPVILSIPYNFSRSDQPKTSLHPHASRSHDFDEMSPFATRLPAMKKVKTSPPTVVTPSKTVQNFVEGKGPGPNLPTLLEAALQLHTR